MASSFSYTTVPGKIPSLLSKLRDVGIPNKVSYEWLKSVGFKSSNDRTLISVLKQAEFVDASNVPTQVWKDYRGSKHKSVLGNALLKGYKELYATYPDAHNRSTSDLESFFSTKTSAGKQSIDKMVKTFKGLAQNADFGAKEAGAAASIKGDSSNPIERVVETASGGAITINLNIQLTLPETTDEKVYDKFFQAMKKHLMDSN